MARLTLISKCNTTIPDIQRFLKMTQSQASAAATEEAKSLWQETQGAWISKYVHEASKLAELGKLNSAMSDYGDDLYGDATERTIDGLSAAYLLAKQNDQTETAATLLGMVQDRDKTASVSSSLASSHIN
jgi:hypothetical protein